MKVDFLKAGCKVAKKLKKMEKGQTVATSTGRITPGNSSTVSTTYLNNFPGGENYDRESSLKSLFTPNLQFRNPLPVKEAPTEEENLEEKKSPETPTETNTSTQQNNINSVTSSRTNQTITGLTSDETDNAGQYMYKDVDGKTMLNFSTKEGQAGIDPTKYVSATRAAINRTKDRRDVFRQKRDEYIAKGMNPLEATRNAWRERMDQRAADLEEYNTHLGAEARSLPALRAARRLALRQASRKLRGQNLGKLSTTGNINTSGNASASSTTTPVKTEVTWQPSATKSSWKNGGSINYADFFKK